ncbi:MarR family winged helix-turn-helix transcriptional regulator [Mycolicibacterium sp. J2]|jgi:DNA-binding MarR family transcriptional regulator|uniref:MarR family winged helix-turn-helix transcriptional regulator n=1 Tax=Mycolicibacterium sp. J2 TaxID=2993511 RepID=UPI00224B5B78|nr:MarR family winged helix-turn-helix transcriptional regulator [Mycolicibacterium sp. J2]MCX2714295.1 MarR family winged helix-turn-helix transcriptional regulator [Mycolicibacterium sp. J2]
MTTVARPDPEPIDVAEALLRRFIKLFVASRHVDMTRRTSGQLTRAQYVILQLVVERGRARVCELARATGVSLPSMSVTVSRLRRHGLISRRPATAPTRNSWVEPTAAGVQEFDSHMESWRRDIETALQRLNSDDRRAIHAAVPVLERLLGDF